MFILFGTLCVAVGAAGAEDPRFGLGLVAALAFLVLVWVRPTVAVALWSISFFIPYSQPGNLLMKGGFALMPLSMLVRALLGARVPWTPLSQQWPVVASIAVLLSWLTVSSLWATDHRAALFELVPWVLAVAVALTVLGNFNGETAAVLLVGAWVTGASIAALTALAGGGGVGGEDDLLRAGGAAGDPNILAAGLVAALPLTVGLWPFVHRRARPALIGVALLCLAGVISSASRGALVAAAIAACAAVAVSRHPWRLAAGLLTGGVVAALAWAVLSPSSWSRVTDFGGGGTGRSELWRAALALWRSSPVIGVGLGNQRVLQPTTSLDIGPLSYAELIVEQRLVAHNVAFQLLADVGIVGFALYAAVVAMCLRASLHGSRRFRAADRLAASALSRSVFVAIAAMFGAGMFLSMGHEYRLWALLAAGPLLAGASSQAHLGQPPPTTAAQEA